MGRKLYIFTYMFIVGFFDGFSCMGVSKNRGTPKWMVKIMENLIKPLFSETSVKVNVQSSRPMQIRHGSLLGVFWDAGCLALLKVSCHPGGDWQLGKTPKVLFLVPLIINRWDRWYIITQLAVLCYLYIANWVYICLPIPPITGTRNLHWLYHFNQKLRCWYKHPTLISAMFACMILSSITWTSVWFTQLKLEVDTNCSTKNSY